MLDRDLEESLKAGDFASARLLAAEFGSQVCSELAAIADPGAREAHYRAAIEELNDNLHLARVLRAHLAAEERANAGAFLYQPDGTNPPRWRFDA